MILRGVSLAVTLGLVLTACAGGGTGGIGSGVSTASVLGEAPASASGDNPGITKADPMARPVQVAWTSARAQKCGFNFDPAKLKAAYLAAEQRQGVQPAQLASYERAYDMTVTRVRDNIRSPQEYCTDRQSGAIKADLSRHLAGDYAPNFPADRALAQKTLWEQFAGNEAADKFDNRKIWQQLEDRKNGVRTAN